MIEQFDFAALRKQVSKQAEKFLGECRKQSPGEIFFGLAFCVDSDVSSFYCQAASEESLDSPGDRFFVTEWKYIDNRVDQGNAALAAVWDAFKVKTKRVNEDVRDKLWDQVRKKCLEAMVQGLQDFRRSGTLPESARKDFALFVYDPDPDDPDEIKAMARELNSPKSYKAFIDPENGFLYA